MKQKILTVILTVAILLSTVSGAAIAADPSYELLQPDTTTAVTITRAGQGAFFRFRAEHSCLYAFHSLSDEDTYAEFYDAGGKLLYENDDFYGMNFGIECRLEAGQEYILAVYFLDTLSTGSFEILTSTCHDQASTLTIPADCTNDGLWTHNCTICDHVWTEIVPAQHLFEDGICTVCNSSMILEGSCGNSLYWRYDGGTKALEISGLGAMFDYADEAPPWQEFADSVYDVVIQDGVTYLGSTAFYGMSTVRSVSIPESVTEIAEYAFSYCSGLKELSLPGSLTTLGAYSFSYCNRLTDVIIPALVNDIGTGAFQGCGTLSGIWVEERNPFYSSDSHGALFDKGQRNLLQVPAAMDGSYTIPYTVITIGASAFEGCGRLSAVTIAGNVQEIQSNAFSGCNRLTFLRLPTSVKEVGDSAFCGCPELSGIIFEGDAPTIYGTIFEDLNANVYYHAENATWTEAFMDRCGDGITWCPISASEIVVEPKSRVELLGNKITYVVGVSGTNLQYAWWIADAGSEQFVKTNVINNVYTMEVTQASLGKQLYCQVIDGDGYEMFSQTVTVMSMPVMEGNEPYTVNIHSDEESYYVAFVPDSSCYYTFRSYGELDTYCELYDAHYYLLGSADDGEDQNFDLYASLEAGKSYILSIRIYDAGVGTFDIDVRNTHGYVETYTMPTCTLDGFTTYTCSACGDSYRELTAPPVGHSYIGEVIAESDCITPGIRKLTCTVCGDTTTEEMELAEHDYGTYVTPPTCTIPGYTTHTCFLCGEDYIENVVSPLGHTAVVDSSVSATCTTTGLTTGKHCSTCNAVLVQQTVIPAIGHYYLDGACIYCLTPDPNYAAGVTIPTLTLKAPTLEFKDMITVNAFYTAENTQDVVEMGMITYSYKATTVSVATAENVIPGATYNESTGRYVSSSQGIHAKYLGDTVYLAVYAKLTDGSYAYSKLAGYSPVQYATNQLKNSADTKLKQLCAAMLNYGAEAQLYFGHNTDALANASLTADQKALPESYRADMISAVPSAPAEKQGLFANNKGFAKRTPSISFEGAFCINYFFTPNYAPDSGITLYYWNVADYNGADVLTVSNATGKIKLEGSGTGQYQGNIEGIAAKALSEAVYVAAAYKSGGTVWTSGVLGYSIGSYCSSQISKGATVAGLAEATAVYGYHAKAYFG